MTFRLMLRNFVGGPLTEAAPPVDDAALAELAARVNVASRARLGRTLSIREVDAGSCNGCELEIHALNNVLYDLERFGLRFVASPRHADVLLVTGPVTRNMREALERTYRARPIRSGSSRSAIARATAASSPAAPRASAASRGAAGRPAHPGCPPSPTALLKGLLALLDGVST
jgi:Ni,Fe-hydrogenase III small subunit